jgi:endonuclease/exonuclease/phosphatase family metal-dependent hydrolase
MTHRGTVIDWVVACDSALMLSALTRNLGHRISAMEWLTQEAALGALPDVLFLQEALPNLLDPVRATYGVFLRPEASESPHGRRSAIAFRRDLGLDAAEDLETFRVLGTYASCARVQLDGRSVILASIHTSPSQLDEEHAIRAHAGTRSCELAPWWADALIAEMSSRMSAPLVIAGDFNEARAWDASNRGHTCSTEFFKAIQEAGFIDITFRDWHNEERPTRRGPDYQLDHVFASGVIEGLVEADDVELVHDDLSDHAAITFTLTR